ncbi:hypothetical protein ACFXG4_20240 [Nocardia sp. NPDC059246]|uniref:hypothetical protein n=1 Tax=unclassified Nocardia TaxID=2637762 RepID=UPI0036AEF73A
MFAVFIFMVTYLLVGVVVANNNYQKRHGLRVRMFVDANPFNIAISIMPRAFIWPLLLAVPSMANPEPCTHERHIEAKRRGVRFIEDI